MAPNKIMMIVVLAAVLLAGIGAIWFTYFSSGTSVPSEPSSISTTGSGTSLQPTVSNSSAFNTTVLQSANYTALDIGLISQGRLPVAPPAGAGKANPFQ